jgi:hypothetical protein
VRHRLRGAAGCNVGRIAARDHEGQGGCVRAAS